MRGTLKKTSIAIAASVAIIGAGITLPTAADARGGHWGGGGRWHGGHGGWGWGGFGVGVGTGLLLGAAAAYPYYGGYYGYGPGYGYYDDPDAYGYGYADSGYGGCTVRRRWVSDGHGHRVWRRVRVCY